MRNAKSVGVLNFHADTLFTGQRERQRERERGRERERDIERKRDEEKERVREREYGH
jgi:hypothetical protein